MAEETHRRLLPPSKPRGAKGLLPVPELAAPPDASQQDLRDQCGETGRRDTQDIIPGFNSVIVPTVVIRSSNEHCHCMNVYLLKMSCEAV